MTNGQRLRSSGRPALAKIDIVVVLGIIVLVTVVAGAPVLSGRRHAEMSRLIACASNLKTLGMAMYTYANENADRCPVAAHAPATEDGKCAVTYAPGKIGTHRGNATDPKAGETTINDTEMSVTRNLWTLIRLKISKPESFICPGTRDTPNKENAPQNLWDFARYGEVSYGMQVSYGKLGRAATDCPCRMTFAADKGPFGAALEAGARNPGPPTPDKLARSDKWRSWNSPNHGDRGQVVLYADGHAQFEPKPTSGIAYDNIYTRWSDATGGFRSDDNIRACGTPPTGNEAPFGDTDSLIYP